MKNHTALETQISIKLDVQRREEYIHCDGNINKNKKIKMDCLSHYHGNSWEERDWEGTVGVKHKRHLLLKDDDNCVFRIAVTLSEPLL